MEYNDKKIGVITSGISYQYAKEALGDKVSYLKLGTVYPVPDKLIKEFSENVEKLYVIEELDPFLEEHIKAMGINVIGKEAFTLIGEYNAAMIKKAILGIEAPEAVSIDEPVPMRPPCFAPAAPTEERFLR